MKTKPIAKPNGWETEFDEKVKVYDSLYSQVRQLDWIKNFIRQVEAQAILSAEERTVDIICKRLDELGEITDSIPVWKSAIKDCVLSEGTKKLLPPPTKSNYQTLKQIMTRNNGNFGFCLFIIIVLITYLITKWTQ